MFTDSEVNCENVRKVLNPKKFFSKEALQDLKHGDTFELCPEASSITQQICSLVEITKGAALVIDYGEDHAFSNSFRVSSSCVNLFSVGDQGSQVSEGVV